MLIKVVGWNWGVRWRHLSMVKRHFARDQGHDGRVLEGCSRVASRASCMARGASNSMTRGGTRVGRRTYWVARNNSWWGPEMGRGQQG